MPLVSVVVIGYNDAEHLPTAVRSAQRQSFRDLEILVVDDASTDATPEVAQRLADADARIRVLRLDANSGGCSRPRNVGVDAARGRYVSFLDSDDELPTRAIARLVTAAERAQADLACGRWVRRHHHPRRVISAHDELYARARVVPSITDEPRLLYDTPAWNKLYRRSLIADNGLRFPEGMLYEDLLFTTEAYCAAKRIALVPDVVYVWHVRRQAESLSITNRGDLRAWRDRFEAHRRIDAFLTEHAARAQLRDTKRKKFLDLDFVLFLRDLRTAAASQRPALFALATDYIGGVPGLASAAPTAAMNDACAATAAADLEGALDAADRVVAGSDDFGAVQRVRIDDGARVTIEGVLRSTASAATGSLELRGRLGGRLATVPVTFAREAGELRFRAEIDLSRLGRRILTPRSGPQVLMDLRPDAGPSIPLLARDAELPDADVHVHTPWHALTGDRLRFVELNGRFVAHLSALPARSDAAIELVGRARHRVRRWRLRLDRGQPSRSESDS